MGRMVSDNRSPIMKTTKTLMLAAVAALSLLSLIHI